MGFSQEQINRFFEIIAASKLPSELAELLSIDSDGLHLVTQDGTTDAKKIKVPLLRGDLGNWNANTNSPTLIDGTGIGGDFYYVTEDGTQDLGSGVNSYLVGDVVQYFSGVWRLRPSTKGTSQTTNYASILPPQLFNPDVTAVSTNTDDYVLSFSNKVAFVTINGKVIDDAEYSLSTSTLTVTPINGFSDTDDEVLVFQHVFATGATGASFSYTSKTSNYAVLESDYYVECTSNSFNVTLPDPATVGAGKTFSIKNSGSGIIDVIAELDEFTVGVPLQLEQYDSVTVASNNTKYITV
jgi:hypothetical protein